MSNIKIREVTEGIWTFSRPFLRFNVFRVGGRSTAIRMKDGGVWVLASTPLTPETKKTIDDLGPVKYLVGPDSVHHIFLAEYHKAYPEAKLVAVEEAINKKKAENLPWHGSWSDSNREPVLGFEDEIKHCYFSGFKNKDVAFFHVPSKTLLTADLIFNFPAHEQYPNAIFPGGIPIISQIFGHISPFSKSHHTITKNLGVDREMMRRDAKTVADWDFTRLIPCHGDVIEGDGNKAWRLAYSPFL
ncbi:hypothetical protein BV25DRAFT_1822651, partial [Artomyces pyxidatus]